ncbi:MAG: N-acetyltransferase [Desulfurellales bacterium]|nr:MAG: N-acetyltransferase [Desulfurellales bacterium]
MTASATQYRIRGVIQKDHPYIARLESAAVEYPATLDELEDTLRDRTTVALVVEDNKEQIIGACVYSNLSDRTIIRHLMVHPKHQRQGIGTGLIKRMKSKLNSKRTRLEIALRDTDLSAHLFLKAQGFTADKIIKKAYENGSDAYVFSYGGKS